MDIWSIWKTHLTTYQVQSRKYAEHVHTKVTLRFPGHTCIVIVHLLRPTADASSRGEAAAKPRPPPRGRCELGEGLGKSRLLWIADMGWHCRRFVSKNCYTVYIYTPIIHIYLYNIMLYIYSYIYTYVYYWWLAYERPPSAGYEGFSVFFFL